MSRLQVDSGVRLLAVDDPRVIAWRAAWWNRRGTEPPAPPDGWAPGDPLPTETMVSVAPQATPPPELSPMRVAPLPRSPRTR